LHIYLISLLKFFVFTLLLPGAISRLEIHKCVGSFEQALSKEVQ